MNAKGTFIVIDGMDGSGKGTQIKLLQEKLAAHPVIFTREPGGTPRAEEIRKILLDKDGPASTPLRDFDLFWEARESHIEERVGPALMQGTHVICDRYDSSTYAFQIHGEQQSPLRELFKAKRESLHTKYHPHAYIILDLPPQVAFDRRLKDSTKEKSRFDLKPLEYHERVREGFAQFSAYLKDGKSQSICHFVDAAHPIEQVHNDIWTIVSKTPGL